MNSEGFKETEIGLIPEDWEIKSLKNLLRDKGYIRGPFGSALRRNELKNTGIPVYEQQHAIYNSRDFRYFIDEVKFKELTRFTIKERDLIISCSGNVGKVSIIKKEDPEGIISQALLILRPNYKEILPEYLKYFFSSRKGYESLISRSGGSVQINLAKKQIIQEIKIPKPPIKEQIEIINVLSSIENKIELNHKINQTLEEIAQTIFRHWFVHYEFPDENGQPYKSTGEEMVDSELGEIPVGWDVKILPEVTTIVDCLHTKKPDISESDNILLQVYNIAEDGTLNFNKIYTVSEIDYAEWTKNILLREGDCIITNAGRVGAVGQVPSGFEGGIGRNITAIRPDKISPTYLFRYLFSKHGKNQVLMLTDHGTILNSLNVKGIKKIRILIPPKDISIAFDSIARPLREKVEKNNSEISYLSRIRDSLLPKLISGRIRVKGSD